MTTATDNASETPWLSEAANYDWLSETTVGDDGVIRNALLCGPKSRNGYPFREGAFGKTNQEARQKYGNKKIYMGHLPSDKLSNPHARSHRDLAGFVPAESVKLDAKGLPRGDIHTEGCPAGKDLLGIAKAKIPDYGLSQVAQYTWTEGVGSEVSDVKHVATIDAVDHPATTNTFTEQTKPNPGANDMTTGATTDHASKLVENQQKEIAELRGTTIPSLERDRDEQKKLVAERDAKIAELTAANTALTTERDGLKNKVDKFETEQAVALRLESIKTECKANGLNFEDKAHVTECFRDTLMAEADESKRKAIIVDRAALVKKAASGAGTPFISTERNDGQDGTKDPLSSEQGKTFSREDAHKLVSSGSLFMRG